MSSVCSNGDRKLLIGYKQELTGFYLFCRTPPSGLLGRTTQRETRPGAEITQQYGNRNLSKNMGGRGVETKQGTAMREQETWITDHTCN